MKLAIIGIINPTLTYQEWEDIFCHHFENSAVSEIRITGSDTLLNRYVRTYAIQFSIPVTVFNYVAGDEGSKQERNNALIDYADLVVVFTIRAMVRMFRSLKGTCSDEYGKKALVVMADKSPKLKQRKLLHDLTDNLADTKHRDLLTVEEEVALVMQIQNGVGDVESAKDKLLNACNRLVQCVARGYVTAGWSLDDLILEGNKGLLHAAYSYDPAQGFRFSSYALQLIRQSIEESITKNGEAKREGYRGNV